MGMASAAITSLRNNTSLRNRKSKVFPHSKGKEGMPLEKIDRTPIVLNELRIKEVRKEYLWQHVFILLVMFLVAGYASYKVLA